MDGIKPPGQVLGPGDFEIDALVAELLPRPLDSLLDRLFAQKQASGDLGVAEAAERLERQSNLVLAREWDDSRRT